MLARVDIMRPGDLRDCAEMLRVLAHPTRLALLAELSLGPRCVGDIQELLKVRQANVSQHLAALRSARIVAFCEHGKMRCYYISRPALVKSLLRFIEGEYPVVELSAEQVRRHARARTSRQRRERARATTTGDRLKGQL